MCFAALKLLLHNVQNNVISSIVKILFLPNTGQNLFNFCDNGFVGALS